MLMVAALMAATLVINAAPASAQQSPSGVTIVKVPIVKQCGNCTPFPKSLLPKIAEEFNKGGNDKKSGGSDGTA